MPTDTPEPPAFDAPSAGPVENPRATIEHGFACLDTALTLLEGGGAPPAVLQDARTHLTAASLCIDAFMGKAGEAG